MEDGHRGTDRNATVTGVIDVTEDGAGVDLEARLADAEHGETKIVYEEAQRVLDYQIQNLNDVDDVAARTVRITVLLVGGLLGIITLGGDNGISLTNPYLMWAGGYLLVAILLGMETYNVSDPYHGPGRGTLLRWANIESEEQLLTVMVAKYAEWIDDMEVKEAINGLFLDLTQVALALGLVYVAVGFFYRISSEALYPGIYGSLHAARASALLGVPMGVLGVLFAVLWGYAAWRF